MNSRPISSDDHELPPSSSSSATRVSARSRFSPPPAASFASSSSYDYGNNDNYRASSASTNKASTTTKSKGGINGRTYDSDDDEEQFGLSSRSALRSAAKRTTSNSSAATAPAAQLNDVAQDFHFARSRSSGSTTSSRSAKDRPWRTAASSTATSGYATANNNNDYEDDEASNNDSDDDDDANDESYDVEVTTSSSNRWSQYETDDLAEESRRATSNAVLQEAMKIADKQEAEPEPLLGLGDAIMGGSVGTGLYRDDGDLDGLERDGNSLAPTMHGRSGGSASKNNGGSSSSSRSTTDYVKSRLSALVTHRNSNSNNNTNNDNDDLYERQLSSSSTQSDHDKVRNEALKMLQIADSCLQDSPRNSRPNSPPNSSSHSGGSAFSGNTTGLFRTKGGGLAMRELDDDEVNKIQVGKKRDKKGVASIAGLDKFKFQREKKSSSKFDGTFTIGSQDEDDQKNTNSNPDPASPNADTPSKWSSRYSVERQLMAITGGLDSTHMLAKMELLSSSREKTKSARGMYRASAEAMDGSHEEYNDYSKNSSTGVGLGGNIWMWLQGTLWSDLGPELNYDGTTQSLVRREKMMQKRRRFRWGALFFVALSVAVGVLVHMGNHQPSKGSGGAMTMSGRDVNFYVLADEPYDFSNVEQLTRELEALPSDAEFVIHLGNANGDAQSQCQEYGFERAAAVLKESPVPVLVIPGDKDWAACGSKKEAEQSLEYWDVNLGKLERNWDHPLKVDYSEDVVGNFAFLHKNVLFISVNIVDAETNPTELSRRLEQNVLWTKSKLAQFTPTEYHAIVIFGHAPPSDKQDGYFSPLIQQIKELQKPVLYLHANSKDGTFEQYTPFEEAENFKAVQLEKRGREAPMRVVVMMEGEEEGEGKKKNEDPFMFERREPTMERTEK
eukprot:CAMPEP_0201879302 /NCGR_PEP_ID=MMETSP0902-20130614/10221_1 /ASSEMBLY_ACC=CAM_ASM_000551 /TAXON_ID=420261 /ORGANISM="Thalassiosira antarctica, Strain CCMP982" /LENGTH=898 /DNA_ID=CAMNT_0048407097 /DNA_START=68 /DNA_END=2764 /DNA_ORIENTATION=+